MCDGDRRFSLGCGMTEHINDKTKWFWTVETEMLESAEVAWSRMELKMEWESERINKEKGTGLSLSLLSLAEELSLAQFFLQCLLFHSSLLSLLEASFEGERTCSPLVQ